MLSGVYKIICTPTKRVYVGSALNLKTRKNLHWSQLNRGTHHSVFMQRAWNKYGASSFKFVTVEAVQNRGDLILREQHYIDALRPAFNSCRLAASSLGYRHTDEAKCKMSALKKGQPSPRLGKKHSIASRAKMSAAKAGFSFFAGRTHSPESRAKMAAAKTGERNVRCVRVEQRDRAGNLIATFCSLIAAYRATGVDVGNIRHVLAGRSKHAGGFDWTKY